ncbi:hypothetical protein CALCODRAFT_232395 [Calocera cornea HHB12733]|uniref:Uncharacterized protein n=1 Tax=Calocera cornea HHB12733 TaxID=1353952 RepID=A0A165H0N1_9BASI|nr:hypothetical protein CALCODRAFT_232395 [Calocera cornea HHB12733]
MQGWGDDILPSSLSRPLLIYARRYGAIGQGVSAMTSGHERCRKVRPRVNPGARQARHVHVGDERGPDASREPGHLGACSSHGNGEGDVGFGAPPLGRTLERVGLHAIADRNRSLTRAVSVAILKAQPRPAGLKKAPRPPCPRPRMRASLPPLSNSQPCAVTPACRSGFAEWGGRHSRRPPAGGGHGGIAIARCRHVSGETSTPPPHGS